MLHQLAEHLACRLHKVLGGEGVGFRIAVEAIGGAAQHAILRMGIEPPFGSKQTNLHAQVGVGVVGQRFVDRVVKRIVVHDAVGRPAEVQRVLTQTALSHDVYFHTRVDHRRFVIPGELVEVGAGIRPEGNRFAVDDHGRSAVEHLHLGHRLFVGRGLVDEAEADKLVIGDVVVGNGDIGIVPLQRVASAFEVGRHAHTELDRELLIDRPSGHIGVGNRNQAARGRLVDRVLDPDSCFQRQRRGQFLRQNHREFKFVHAVGDRRVVPHHLGDLDGVVAVQRRGVENVAPRLAGRHTERTGQRPFVGLRIIGQGHLVIQRIPRVAVGVGLRLHADIARIVRFGCTDAVVVEGDDRKGTAARGGPFTVKDQAGFGHAV